MNCLARFAADRSGAAIAYVAVMAPVLAGLAGLAVDTGMWYAQSRHAQAAADSAAVAGALEVLRSDSNHSMVVAAAEDDLEVYGYSIANGDGVTINFPPNSGPYAGAMDKVEVVVSRPAFRTFSAVFLDQDPNVSARAVGVADINDTCVWALNPSAPASVSVSGTANVSLGCGVFVNSSDPAAALNENGSGCLTATKIKVVGGSSGDCLNPSPLTGASPVADPMASLPAPPSYTPGVCDFSGGNYNGGTVNLTPGAYCGAIKAVSTTTLNFAPGLYILEDAGTLDIGAQATVTGIGVSFYISANNTKSIKINAGADVTLKAPPDGELPGVLLYHDRNSTSNVIHKINGGADMTLEGIIYFPKHDLEFAGGSTLDTTSTMIVADTVTFTGNTEIGDLSGSSASANPLLITAGLVE